MSTDLPRNANVTVGDFLPHPSTASGRAHLAHMRSEVVEAAPGKPLATYPGRAVTEPAAVEFATEGLRPTSLPSVPVRCPDDGSRQFN